MSHSLFIAKRLGLTGDGKSSPLLRIAVVGIALALVIMILSFAIVTGFRDSITSRIYALDAHIKISMYQPPDSVRPLPISRSRLSELIDLSAYGERTFAVSSQACVVKTDSDFKGLSILGIDADYPIDYISQHLEAGKLPDLASDTAVNQIAISSATARQLNIGCGDRIHAYFIDNSLRTRRLTITGIFNTDFEDYDNVTAISNRHLINELCHWDYDLCSYVGISLESPEQSREVSGSLLLALQEVIDSRNLDERFSISNISDSYASYFTWLDILDTNIIVILVLMTIVAGFALIAGLLIIILRSVAEIGLMKSLGATTSLIRRVYLLLGLRLLGKAIIVGNILGFALALIQYFTHVVPLDAKAYNMPYVPISFDWTWIVGLNVGAVLVAYLAMIIPTHVIAGVSPSETMRYD